MNTIILSGTVQRDPEIKHFETGKIKVTATLAVRQDRKTDGKYLNDFFDLVIWGNQAESFAQHCGKGKPVEVVGSMTSRTYEKDGQKRKVWEVNVQRFSFVPKDFSEGRESEQGGGYDAEELPF